MCNFGSRSRLAPHWFTKTTMPENETYEDTVYVTPSFGKYRGVLWIALCVFVCALNTLAIGLIIWQRKKTRVRSHWYIVSLAVADLLVGAVASISHTIYAFESRNNTRSAGINCVIATTFTWTFVLESLNHLMMISIDRMVSVVWPVKYRTYIQTSKVWWFIGLAWVLSVLEGLLSGLCAFFLSADNDSVNTNDVCTSKGLFTTKHQGFHIYIWIRFTLGFIGIVGSYTYLFMSHRSHVKNVSPLLASIRTSTELGSHEAANILRKRKENAAARQTWKLGRAVVIPILAVFALFFPRVIYHFVSSFGLEIFPPSFLNIANVMVLMNSAVNPCLYIKCIPGLKDGIVNMLSVFKRCCNKGRNRGADGL